MAPDWGWQDFAACQGESLVLFFGPDGERQIERVARELRAKAICTGCPARNPCLNYALDRPEKYGTWGGLNEDERASERRRRMRRAAGYREPEHAAEKQCPACQATKSAEEFGNDRTRPDGLGVSCKDCSREMRRQREAKQAVA